MISQLTGTVSYHNEKFAVLNVGGVGYKVHGTFETLEKAALQSQKGPVTIWTHLVVREDALDLYGFLEKEALDFFELLISISGIGPKSALGILNVATVSALKKAVSSGDTSHLTKVSGIGKKNADKIVLELKGKFGLEGNDEAGDITLREEVDALEALKSLGFDHKASREALKNIPIKTEGGSKGHSTSDRVKAALKILSK